jgi:hypothetical protein
MVENLAAEVEYPEGESLPVPGERSPDGALALPEEVVASLAGQLAERARAGGPVTLTGPGGLLLGLGDPGGERVDVGRRSESGFAPGLLAESL